MSLDLQKVTLRRLLETQNHDLYSKLVPAYFGGANSIVYNKVQNFYKANMRIPSLEEFLVLKKDVSTQEYLETEIYDEENINKDIADEFLVSQLQDFYIREETIGFLDKFIDDLDDLEKVEIVDKFHEIALKAGGTSEGSGGERPEGSGVYYSYIRDLDGNKICAFTNNK